MKIKYTGTPGEDRDQISMYGYDFPKGKFVDVKDPFAVRKLSKHPHFDAKTEEITDVEAKKQEEELQTLVAQALEPIETQAAEEQAHASHDEATGEASPRKVGRPRKQ